MADERDTEADAPSADGASGPQPPSPGGALAGATASPESAAFLVRVRENLRGKLFGSTLRPVAEAETLAPIETQPTVPGAAPKKIGRYEVLGRIGSGGMGVIYSAYDASLGRKVAVKLLNPKGGRNDDARNRLMREAQALARLSHPSVVHVYEVGEFEDQVFIAMEFVKGETLRAWQSRGERSWRSILAVYKAAAEGLAAGHAAGIVHRDFKPDNVLVSADGDVRVIDFGLARTNTELPTTGEDARALPIDSDLALTKTGTLMGTPAYMAPEQFKGDSTDGRTDQFAYSVALYEALYGYRPFAGTTIKGLAINVLSGSVEPPPKYTDVPERLYRVLLRGLEVDPIERYDDMSGLVSDLPLAGSRLWWWALAAMGGLALAGLVTFAAWSWRSELRREESLLALRTAYVSQRGAEAETQLRAHWAREPARRYDEVVLRTAEGLLSSDPTAAVATLKGLTGSAAAWLTPARILAAAASEEELQVRRVQVPAGPVTELAVDRLGETMAIGTETFGVFRYEVGATSGAADPMRGGPQAVTSLAMSQDGSLVLAGGADGIVYLWRGTDEASVWAKFAPGPVFVAMSADGKTIAAGDRTGRLALGKPAGVTKTEAAHRGAVVAVGVSTDGKLVASAGEDRKLRLAFLDQKKRWEFDHRASASAKRIFFGDDQRHVDVLGTDGRVWRVSTMERRSTLLDEPQQVELIARAADAPVGATYGAGQPLRVTVDDDGPSAHELYQGKLTALAVSGNGRAAVAAGADNTLRQWSVVRAKPAVVSLADATVLAVAQGPKGRLAIGGSSGLVRVWGGAEDERSKGQLMGGVHELSFAPAGGRLAALGGLGGITVWDLDADAAPVSLLPASFESPIGWSEDGTRIIAQNCEGPQRCGLVVHALDTDERMLSTVLGMRIESFALSGAAQRALMVRSGDAPDVQHFVLGESEVQSVGWPAVDPPAEVVAHAFVDNANAVRLVTRDESRIRLWHWVPDMELLSLLDEFEAEAVYPDPMHRMVLSRGSDGGELWFVDEALRRPIGALPKTVHHFEVSADGDTVMIEGDDGALLVHVPTGIRRTLSGIRSPYAWRGASSFAIGQSGGVELRSDPTPDAAEPFLLWLDSMTDAQPPAGITAWPHPSR